MSKQYTVQAPDGKIITLEGPDNATQEEVIAQAQALYKPDAVKGPPAKPVEATFSDILSRFGSPTGQPETFMEKLRRATTKEPNVVTGMESTGHPVLDIMRGAFEGSVPGTAAVSTAAKVVPSAERASKNFETVLAAAKKVPVDTSKAETIAGAAETLSEHGAKLPKVIRDFIKTHTNASGPLTYETTKDFASNAGKLSASESKAIIGAMKHKVTEFWQAMKEGNRAAADKVGMGEIYDAAMKEYRQAANLQQAGEILTKWGKRIVAATAIGSAGTAGYDIYRRIMGR